MTLLLLYGFPQRGPGGGGGQEGKGGSKLGIPTVFDFSLLNFGQLFYPGAETSIQTLPP